jgi:glycosyltransferase involved in cell wall biosynthesis
VVATASGDVAGEAGASEPVAGMVSIIITCFNGERWIRQAVDSALAQSYPHREIVIVDDASTDGSLRCLEPYRSLPGVELVAHPVNLGIPATKNDGVRHSRGEYLAFLEQDDEWAPAKLERQVAAFEADAEVGLVYTTAVYLAPDGGESLLRQPVSVPQSSRRAAVEAVFRNNPVTSMSSVAVRRHCLAELGGFDESFHGADDYDLWLRMAGQFKMVHVDQPLVRYRRHAGSFSAAHAERMLEDRLRIIRQAADAHPYLRPLLAQRLAAVWSSSAVLAFEQRAGRQALAYAARALRLAPGRLRHYAVLGLVATGGVGRRLLARWRRGTQFEPRPRPAS